MTAAHRVTWFTPPDRPVEGNTVYVRPAPTGPPAAPLIDQPMCRYCGASLVDDVKAEAGGITVTYRRCPCRPRDPEQTAADVRHRHDLAVRTAQVRAERVRRDMRGAR